MTAPLTGSRSALVTGATRGIGLGIASQLARLGYSLTISARDPVRLDEAAASLRALGAPLVESVAGDVADRAVVRSLARRHRDVYGALSCLVLNAGIGTASPIASLPERRWDTTVAVNLTAPFLLMQACLEDLRAGAAADPVHGARVLVLSSITGVYAEPGLAAYGATKAALNLLVEGLNAEESHAGVSGTAIAPGYVDTEMTGWLDDVVPAEHMLPVDDVVALVVSLLALTRRAVVPRLVVHRAGTSGHVA